METQYRIENLGETTVAIRIVTIENGKKIKMRRSYCNSNYDRNELLNLLPIELYNQIIEVWGNEATVADLPDPRVHAE